MYQIDWDTDQQKCSCLELQVFVMYKLQNVSHNIPQIKSTLGNRIHSSFLFGASTSSLTAEPSETREQDAEVLDCRSKRQRPLAVSLCAC